MRTSRLLAARIFAAILLCAASRLPAGHDEEEGNPRFHHMDTDHDGRLSRKEHALGANGVFNEMDADHDGIVTAAELDAHAAQRQDAAIRFNAAPPPAERSFDSGAARADGSVSSHEVANARGAAPAALSSAEKIRLCDRDGDGRMTAAEHAAGAGALFARLDTDGDGFLSRIESQGGITLAAHR